MNVRVRDDLEFHVVNGYGEPTWVVRDPLTLVCYRLGAAEHFLLTELKRTATLDRLCDLFNRAFAPQTISLDELQSLLVDWALKQLLLVDPILLQRWRAALQIAPTAADGSFWRQALRNPLVIRFRGWDPQRFLSWLTPRLLWLYSWPISICVAGLCLTAGWIAISSWPTMIVQISQLPRLFGPQHWLLVLVCVAGAKILHELGHAVTCHRYGGRCHEMGVMLLVFVPCLYCNVTDAWTFRRRSERVAVSAAGIIVDVCVASACLIGWYFTQAGVLHSLCLLLAVFGSINSLLLNGNPLMRYDGYFIVSDLLGQANLRSESLKQMQHFFWRAVLGPRADGVWQVTSVRMALFGMLCSVYLWVVLALILMGLYAIFEPWGAGGLVVAAGMVLVPAQLWALGRSVAAQSQQEYRSRGRRSGRAASATLLAIVLCGALLLIPLPRRIPAYGVLRPATTKTIVCYETGLVSQVANLEQQLEPGDIVFQLQNRELELAIARLKTDQMANTALLKAVTKKRIQFSDSSDILTIAQQTQAALSDQLEQLSRRKERLTQRTLTPGQLLPNPYFGAGRSDRLQPQPEHSAFTSDIRGSELQTGEILGEVSPQSGVELLIAVEQSWANLVELPAQTVVFVPELGSQWQVGTLVELAPVAETLDPQQTSQISARTLEQFLATLPGAQQKQFVAGQVKLNLADPVDWNVHQMCRVRISVEPASILQRVLELFRRTWKQQ